MSPNLEPAPVRVRTPGKHIVLFAAAAVAVAGAGVNFMNASTTGAPPDARMQRAASPKPGAALVEEFLLDLQPDRSGRTAYLKLAAVIAPASDDARARIEEERAAIRERLAFLLRGLTPEDLAGADGMARVKAEMLRRVNLVIAPQQASDVVITDIVIQ